MEEYVTGNGTKLFYKVGYDLGGYNMFTGALKERGYYLTIQRKYNCFSAFSDLSSSDGAIRVLLLAVNRQSKKASKQAEDLALGKIKEIVSIYNSKGIVL